MSDPQAPGKIFLIIAGVLDIVMGGFAALLALFGLFDRFFWNDVEQLYPPILVLLLGIWSFVIGILAIAYCSTLSKSKLLRTFGLIDLAFCVIGMIIKGYSFTNLANIFIPLLYCYGAFKNTKSLTKQNDNNLYGYG